MYFISHRDVIKHVANVLWQGGKPGIEFMDVCDVEDQGLFHVKVMLEVQQ